MEITLVNINGFTFNALEKLMDFFEIDEIIDARMNLGSIALRHFYNGHFPKVRYIIKLANTRKEKYFELEYRKGEHETPFGKALNRLCSSTNEVIGLDRLMNYVQFRNISLKEQIEASLQSNNCNPIFSDYKIEPYFFDISNDLSHIIRLYKTRFKGGNKINSLYELEAQLEYIRDCIVRVEEEHLRHNLGVEGMDEFRLNMGYYTKDPRPYHFLDVTNICILYNGNKSIRESFLKFFSPEQYEYEKLSEWKKMEYDNTHYVNEEYDNDDFDDYRDCYKQTHWIKFEEINREDFFDIEKCDLCKTEEDYERIKKEKEKWIQWQKAVSSRNKQKKEVYKDTDIYMYEEDYSRDTYYVLNEGTDNIYKDDVYDPYWDSMDWN